MQKGESLTIKHALKKFQNHGYDTSFMFRGGELVCRQTGRKYSHHQLKVIEKYRTEGETDPDEMAIIYGIETDDGTKGTITDAFGTYADPELGEFISHITDITEDQEKIEHLEQ